MPDRSASRLGKEVFAVDGDVPSQALWGRAPSHMDQAYALVLQKEIGEGAKVAEQVTDITAAHRCVRLTQWMGDVRRLMQPWASTFEVRTLDERLIALGPAS